MVWESGRWDFAGEQSSADPRDCRIDIGTREAQARGPGHRADFCRSWRPNPGRLTLSQEPRPNDLRSRPASRGRWPKPLPQPPYASPTRRPTQRESDRGAGPTTVPTFAKITRERLGLTGASNARKGTVGTPMRWAATNLGRSASAPARSGGIYPPPHAMFACAAARWHSAMPEGGCRSSAKRRTQRHDRAASAVVEEETRHILARKPLLHIGEAPRTCTLNLGANPAARTPPTQPRLTASSEMLSIS
jgi:hypothetical protein